VTSNFAAHTDPLSTKLEENQSYFNAQMVNVADFQWYSFQMGEQQAAALNLVCLVDGRRVHEELIMPLVNNQPVVVQPLARPTTKQEVMSKLLEGHTVVLFDGYASAISVQINSPAMRGVEESQNEYVGRGPRDSFTESWQVNLGQLRRRIKSPDLQVVIYTLGTYTQTTCALVYVQGIASDDLVQQVKQKMSEIQLEAIIDSAHLETVLQDDAYTPFEQIENTERPDKVSMEVLKGRVAILVDTTPVALILPATLFDLIEATGDSYLRPLVASFRKMLRFAGFLIATYASSVYLSLVLYHTHLIPIKFVQILAEKRVKVPFPAWFEIFMMQFMIDLALEAIMRLPTRLSQIIGVAGAIVLGQAVISLNLVSPMVIVVVALTTIAGYVQPHLSTSFAISILRYFNLFLAGILGLYGIVLFIMFWVVHLCGLNPYHTPYLRPLSPLDLKSFRNALVKLNVPWVGSKRGGRR
jgi:hypothetical protein